MTYKLLDLYCGAGGASMGFADAGFEVTGVDIYPQKRYPFDFYEGDALEFLKHFHTEYDAFFSSPPCQVHSIMTRGRWQDRLDDHPDLVSATRDALIATGKPYIIENVPGAPLVDPVMLCGTMFGLETRFGSQLRRHRLFECSFTVGLTPPCQHKKGSVIGVYGGGQHPQRRRMPAVIGVYGSTGGSSKRDNKRGFTVDDRRDAMGIQWMTGKELSQAIPPAYTRWLSKWLLRELDN